MSDKSSREGQEHGSVQPLAVMSVHATRTVDVSDRQNLADTAVAGASHEPRAAAPPRSDKPAWMERTAGSTSRRGDAPDPPRRVPVAAYFLLAALGSALAAGVAWYILAA